MKKKTDQTLTKLADAAFQRAAQKVIERAEEAGTPIIVWKHEAIQQLELRNTRKSRKKGNNR